MNIYLLLKLDLDTNRYHASLTLLAEEGGELPNGTCTLSSHLAGWRQVSAQTWSIVNNRSRQRVNKRFRLAIIVATGLS
jgi:hypothetical protein